MSFKKTSLGALVHLLIKYTVWEQCKYVHFSGKY